MLLLSTPVKLNADAQWVSLKTISPTEKFIDSVVLYSSKLLITLKIGPMGEF